ncbi:MAG: tripartite tricarboxylate transporter substrate binding protein [Betaproteobacteria bacterium]|nr:tripartite tricarboxylate transporter substrate binding protein [Betaproteobacteria bacterium]
MNQKSLGALGLLFASITLTPVAVAAEWPEKAIRVIIPWPPGGSTDIVGRLLAAELTRRLKQQVIIDNRPGAGSILGMQLAAQTPPDGHNFMITSTAYGHLIYKERAKGIDYVKSFAHVALLGFGDSVLAVHPSLPVKSVKELIALAKKRPGALNYSSSGIGGFPHMNTELFKLMTGTSIVHVPFQGGGPAVADTIAGNTQIQIGSITTLIAHIRSGRLKVLGVGGTRPNPQLPGIPTISDAGVPGFSTYIWWGMFAPLRTPPNIINRMHAEVTAVLDAPDMRQKLDVQGAVPEKMSAAEFGRLMVAETEKWLKVIKAANIKGE